MKHDLEYLFVELTNKCLQQCIHCSSCACSNNYSYISSEWVFYIINQAIPLGLKGFTISGGEPLLYPKLLDICDYLQEKNIITTIYTCGVIGENGNNVRAVSKSEFAILKSHGVRNVIISLHGGTKQTQARISGLDCSFALATLSIQNAICSGLHVEIHIVPMSLNFNELENVIKLAEKFGVSQISFLRLVTQGRCSPRLLLSKEQMIKLYHCYLVWKDKYKGIDIRLGTPMNCISFAGKKCTAGYNKLMISAHGEYFPCEAFKYMKGRRPTIYDVPVKEEWENDVLLNTIRRMSIEEVSYCSDCKFKDSCLGGCAGQRMAIHHDLKVGPDPCCIL